MDRADSPSCPSWPAGHRSRRHGTRNRTAVNNTIRTGSAAGIPILRGGYRSCSRTEHSRTNPDYDRLSPPSLVLRDTRINVAGCVGRIDNRRSIVTTRADAIRCRRDGNSGNSRTKGITWTRPGTSTSNRSGPPPHRRGLSWRFRWFTRNAAERKGGQLTFAGSVRG